MSAHNKHVKDNEIIRYYIKDDKITYMSIYIFVTRIYMWEAYT